MSVGQNGAKKNTEERTSESAGQYDQSDDDVEIRHILPEAAKFRLQNNENAPA